MPEKLLFEYAVIRAVPRVEREEFINVGVILYCSAKRFLDIRFLVNEAKLSALCEACSLPEVTERLSAFTKICEGAKDGGSIAMLPAASRFRWLTASRSTVIQTSKVHPGLCIAPDETLMKLFEQLVL